MKKLYFTILTVLFVLSFSGSADAQSVFGIYENEPTNLKIPDNGKMWIFDNPPLEYWNAEYGFTLTKEWLEDVRLSALRFGRGCSASFVSGDGLIMTNNHCAEWTKELVALEGEDFTHLGFYAETLEQERKVPDLSVRQIAMIEDVTADVQTAMAEGKTDAEKFEKKTAKINEIQEKFSNETGLLCEVESFYNGGKYSLYGYRVYDDIRLVFIPEPAIASYGGDFDNFTYPRYDLDCAFFRAYDTDGFPLKSDHYFKWSDKGVQEGDVSFTVGNPGSTQRLKTVAQLEYLRDIQYRNQYYLYDTFFKDLTALQRKYPDKFDAMEAIKRRIGNTQKVYYGRVMGLKDPELMNRKKEFEQKLIDVVNTDPEMKRKYGHVWQTIESLQAELRNITPKIDIYTPRDRFIPAYFTIADSLLFLIEELKKPEEDRAGIFNKDEEIKQKIADLFPEEFDEVIENARLKLMADYIIMNLGTDDEMVKDMFGGKTGTEAVEYILSNSKIKNNMDLKSISELDTEALINLEDPFMLFAKTKKAELENLQSKKEEIENTEEVNENLLGEALFSVYGTVFPPDANMTIRISDGVLKGFEYNGTIAPVKTTFYGLYDRYYSTDKQYPWDLPETWKNPAAEFDMSVEFNFVTTHDIVGGNSGSAVINADAEAIGLAFDGNILSNIGNTLFVPSDNRCVSVSTLGMMEAFRYIYKATRMADELKNGKIVK